MNYRGYIYVFLIYCGFICVHYETKYEAVKIVIEQHYQESRNMIYMNYSGFSEFWVLRTFVYKDAKTLSCEGCKRCVNRALLDFYLDGTYM